MGSFSRSRERAANRKSKKGDAQDYHPLVRMLVFLIVFVVGATVTFAVLTYVGRDADELQTVLIFWGGVIVSVVLGVVSAVTMKKPPEVKVLKRPKEKSSWVSVKKQSV